MAPLDLDRVDRIHRRLALRYGARWLNLWAGVPIGDVKDDWARQLAGLSDAAILHALANLPTDQPPNVAQFRALCINRPQPGQLALPAPTASKKRVDAAVARAHAMQRAADPKSAARQLREREQRGERLSVTQKAMWRAALAGEPATAGAAA